MCVAHLRWMLIAVAAILVAGLVVVVPSETASAQTTYFIPPRSLDPEEPCPDGQSVTIKFVDEFGGGLRYCNQAEGFVEVATQAECDEAFAQFADGRGLWIETPGQGACFGGGWIFEAGQGVAEECTTAHFAQNITFAGRDVMNDVCMVHVYKAADVVVLETATTIYDPDVSNLVTWIINLDDVAVGTMVTFQFNPIIWYGRVPADGIIQFPYPAGQESVDLEMRTTSRTGEQYIERMTVPAVGLPPLPPAEPDGAIPVPYVLAVTDPYVCGGGFTGTIDYGTPPFTIGYRLEGLLQSYDLGGFVSDTASFTTPDGFIDYDVIPEGRYDVKISVADSSQTTHSVVAEIPNELITSDCGETPVAAAPTAAEAAPEEVLGEVQHAAADQPSALAHTATDADPPLLLSQLLLGLGFLVLAGARVARSRSDDEEPSSTTPPR